MPRNRPRPYSVEVSSSRATWGTSARPCPVLMIRIVRVSLGSEPAGTPRVGGRPCSAELSPSPPPIVNTPTPRIPQDCPTPPKLAAVGNSGPWAPGPPCRKMTIEFRKLGLDRGRTPEQTPRWKFRESSHVWNKAPRREEENETSTINIQDRRVAGPLLCYR